MDMNDNIVPINVKAQQPIQIENPAIMQAQNPLNDMPAESAASTLHRENQHLKARLYDLTEKLSQQSNSERANAEAAFLYQKLLNHIAHVLKLPEGTAFSSMPEFVENLVNERDELRKSPQPINGEPTLDANYSLRASLDNLMHAELEPHEVHAAIRDLLRDPPRPGTARFFKSANPDYVGAKVDPASIKVTPAEVPNVVGKTFEDIPGQKSRLDALGAEEEVVNVKINGLGLPPPNTLELGVYRIAVQLERLVDAAGDIAKLIAGADEPIPFEVSEPTEDAEPQPGIAHHD
jgi:hypothetical protein